MADEDSDEPATTRRPSPLQSNPPIAQAPDDAFRRGSADIVTPATQYVIPYFAS